MQTSTPFQDHFSTASDDYKRFRPLYPHALFDYLARISPATHAFLRNYDLSYAIAVRTGVDVVHPLSIAPNATKSTSDSRAKRRPAPIR